jgi:hypothetical protein
VDYLTTPQEHAPGQDVWADNCFDCDWVPRVTWGITPPLNPPYRRKRRGENYLESVEPQRFNYSGRTLYFEKSGSQGKEVPFLPSYHITYNEFLNAYTVDRGMYDP